MVKRGAAIDSNVKCPRCKAIWNIITANVGQYLLKVKAKDKYEN